MRRESFHKFKTPVLLIAYNKPHTTAQVFQAIRKARPPRLYLAVDGPKNPENKSHCEQIQSLVKQVDWKCQVRTRFSKENQGCAWGVTRAITWFFQHEPEGIILEDDCLPNDSFFMYCQNLLHRYRNDTRISIISGSNHLLDQFPMDSDYYYSHMSHIWGWASWKRTWENYSLQLKNFQTMKSHRLLEHFVSEWLPRQKLKNIFRGCAERTDVKNTSWDYAFFYHNLTQHRLSVISAKNLVRNIGFDGTGNSNFKPGQHFVYADMETHEIDTEHLKGPETMIPFFPGDIFTLKQEFKCVTWRGKGKNLYYLMKEWLIKMLYPYLKFLRDRIKK